MRFAATIAVLALGILLGSPVLAAAPAKTVGKAAGVPAIHYQFAVFLLPDCGGNPLAVARELARKNLRDFKPRAPTGNPAVPHMETLYIKNARTNYPPPDSQFVHYFGRGLTAADADALQKSSAALVLNFSYSSQDAHKAMLSALTYTERLASRCKGLIWDNTTREVFTPTAWHEKRIHRWTEDGPRISGHTVIHAYKNTEFIRAITLGMQKFHLPDLVINDFVWSNNRQMSDLITLIGQTLLEGNPLNPDLSVTLKVDRLRHKDVREQLQASLLDATAEVIVHLKVATAEAGDPNNLLLEVDFRNQPGNTLQEKQQALITKLFGSTNTIVYVKHDDAVKAASSAAREKLPQLAKDFNNGLQPGEYIYLKTAFATQDGGNEWMWFEVISWEQDNIRGILQNAPRHIPDLKAGSAINVKQADIFDYIRYFPDGSSEGNETGKLIEDAAQKPVE